MSKPWRCYVPWKQYDANFCRVLQQAAENGYQCEFGSPREANAFLRTVQKVAADIRRDPQDASRQLVSAAHSAMWSISRPDQTTWIVRGRARPPKPESVNAIAARLP